MTQALEDDHSNWQEKWKACRLCVISNCSQNKHILGLGKLNARVLAIGEAPGPTERALGEPFVGRAGTLLRTAFRHAQVNVDDIYITNTIACFPRENDSASEFRKPTTIELTNCSSRIWELMDMMYYHGYLSSILLIGRVAEGFYAEGIGSAFPGIPFLICSIEHPSSLLRKEVHDGATEESARKEWSAYVEKIRSFYEEALTHHIS